MRSPGVNGAPVQHRGAAASALAARRVMPDQVPAEVKSVVLLAGIRDVRSAVVAILHRAGPPDDAAGLADRIHSPAAAGARDIDDAIVGGRRRREGVLA